MAKYESSIKQIAASQAAVYTKLSDLSNLQVLKEKLNDPAAVERIKASGKVTDEQLEKARKQLHTLSFTTDTLSVEIPPIGKITIQITERQPQQMVKFEATQSPVPVKFWIQVLPTGESSSKMKLTLDASLNPFIKMMVEKPLKEGLERVADALSMIPYDQE
jgi:hypothetical protein